MDGATQRHLLVVDDEPPVLRLLTRVLERSAYRVSAAPTGEAALELAHGHEFDAAIIDLTLPGIDGGELARSLRQRQPALPVLITSGHDSAKARATVNLDDAEFLQKPFTPGVLLEVIDRVLSEG